MPSKRNITIGIDASNIRTGGGLTHLIFLLNNLINLKSELKIIVWSNKKTLNNISDSNLIKKVHFKILDWPLLFRMIWQQFFLPLCLNRASCDILFSPGGILPIRLNIPSVVLSQNLLPFDRTEAERFKLRFMRFKIQLLYFFQKKSFERADGVIFLTKYAQEIILPQLKYKPKNIIIIPHGIDPNFFCHPKIKRADFFSHRTIRILYVSIIDVYKHQWHVAVAVDILRKRGLDVIIEFVGPAYKPALKTLNSTIKSLDPQNCFLFYKGPADYIELPTVYQNCDIFVYASSCENLPIILLEAMASGLPIASSNRGPMAEVLGNSCAYFDPEKPESIASAISGLIFDHSFREFSTNASYLKAQKYSWESCAEKTFNFLENVANK